MRGGGDGGIRARKDDTMDVREYQTSQSTVGWGDPKIPGRHLRSRSNRNHSKVSEIRRPRITKTMVGIKCVFLAFPGYGNGKEMGREMFAHIFFPKFWYVAKEKNDAESLEGGKKKRLEPQNRTKIVKKPKFHDTTPTKHKKTTSPLQTEALACHEEEAEGDEEGGEVAGHHVVPIHHPHPPGAGKGGEEGRNTNLAIDIPRGFVGIEPGNLGATPSDRSCMSWLLHGSVFLCHTVASGRHVMEKSGWLTGDIQSGCNPHRVVKK